MEKFVTVVRQFNKALSSGMEVFGCTAIADAR